MTDDPKLPVGRKFRAYSFERDDQGMPTKMYWCGDRVIAGARTAAEKEMEKLAEWERIYGRRDEPIPQA